MDMYGNTTGLTSGCFKVEFITGYNTENKIAVRSYKHFQADKNQGTGPFYFLFNESFTLLNIERPTAHKTHTHT
jgi:hypothetical protein